MVMAAAMGADEFGFGSIAMIATGCIMARICHTNNCPVGVASQVRLCLFSLVLYMIFFFFFFSFFFGREYVARSCYVTL